MNTPPTSGPLFSGVSVALVTLFGDDGDVLVDATAEHAARLAGLGVRAITLAGTTGEPWFLTEEERVALIGACRARVPADVPVIAGTGHPDVAIAQRMTAAAQGADAALVLSMPGLEDQRAYFAAVAQATPGLPILAYHLPTLSAPGVSVEQLPDLPVRGVKDSSGDAERLALEIERYDGELYVGSSALLSLAGPLGATGAILALANVEPERCAQAFAGDVVAQRGLLGAHLDSLVRFPAQLKEAVAERFGTPAGVRLVPPDDHAPGV